MAGFKDYRIAEDRDVKGGPKDATWATGVRLVDRESGQQISVLNVHLVKGAVKGGRPVPGRKALFRLYAEQVAGTVAAIKSERSVGATDEVYILGAFNVGYEADVKRKHKKLPYRKYTALKMRSMWKGSPHLDDKLGTHSDALIDQVWTTDDSAEEKIHYDIDESDHWPPVATYLLAPVPGHTPVDGTVGFEQGYSVEPVKEGTGKKRQANLAFVLVGDTDHGYPRFEFTGTADRGVLYEDGSDYLVDWSELYDGEPGATIRLDFQGDGEDEPDEPLARTNRDSVGRKKAARRLGKIHARVANSRKALLHDLTSVIVKGHASVVIEDLNAAGMLANRKLARAVSDASFAELRRLLEYKADWYGTDLVVADRWFPSSKTCSGCGAVDAELTLADRVYDCPSCGLVIDRDVNAAINLARYTPPPAASSPLPAAA